MSQKSDRFKFFALFTLLYSQGALLYSLWGSTATHYLTLSTIHVTTFVVLLKLNLDHSSLSKNKREGVLFTIFAISLALLVYGARLHSESVNQYEADFNQHEKYVWKLERANFISSMNPRYFESSMKLIQKYSIEPAIHIVSKYDAILPFLAKKYSAMPFFELSKFFVTPRELALSIERIQQDRPEYLFVDADIKRDFTIDIVDPHALNLSYFHGLSVQRVKRLELLQQVFEAVQADYELVEQGALISVYKRK
jgi:hypothetical protein